MLLWFLGTPVSIAEVNHIFYAILFGDITEKCLTTWFMKTGIGSGNLFPMFLCFLNSELKPKSKLKVNCLGATQAKYNIWDPSLVDI